MADCDDATMLRGWISRNLDYDGVQARIKVNGEERSKSFPLSAYDGVDAMEAAAESWLDEQRAKHPGRYRCGLRKQSLKGKKYPELPAGISYGTMHENGKKEIAKFQVIWHDRNRCKRNKTFRLGDWSYLTRGNLEIGLIAALAFRREYERCRLAGEVFDVHPWQGRECWSELGFRILHGVPVAISVPGGLVAETQRLIDLYGFEWVGCQGLSR